MQWKHMLPHFGKQVQDLIRHRWYVSKIAISTRPMRKERKMIQDRFKAIVDECKDRAGKDKNMSDTGGEISELENLLGHMLQTRKDSEESKNRCSLEKEKQEQQKLLEGQEIVLNSWRGKDKRCVSDEEDYE